MQSLKRKPRRQRLCLLRREIASLRSWMRDAPSNRAQPSRWVVESRLRQLTEEAERLAADFLQARGLRVLGRNLRWPDGEGPTTGQQYTIMGRKHPEYYVFQDFPQDRAHHHGRDLPRRVVLRKIDLLGREAA